MGRKKQPHELTLAEFIGGEDPEVRQEEGFDWNDEEFAQRVETGEIGSYTLKEEEIYRHPTQRIVYSVATLDTHPSHALLLADNLDGTGPVIAGEFYRDGFGNVLGILPEHRGIGVGPHFVAGAVKATGNYSPSPVYSPAGLITRQRAHQLLVEEALRTGKRVPKKVLADYPDLT